MTLDLHYNYSRKAERSPNVRLTHHLELVKNWKLHGLTNVEIAQKIGIAEKTLYVWLKKSPKLKKAIRGGKDIARARAENALYELALNGDRQA
ncbi:hypothetical protein J7U30_10335, partial (plasmid) [Lactobacillus delbrueckii subsp. lactis]